MSGPTIHVSNISHTTSESEINNFFSFCGKITSLTLTPTTGEPTSPKSATITFERDAAAKTAVLLNGTLLEKSKLSVTAAQSIDDLASGGSTSPKLQADGQIHQEQKPRSAIFAEYLSSGYVLGDDVLQRGLEFDKKQGLTAKFASMLRSIDQKTHALERAKTMDTQYHLTEKAEGARDTLQRYFERALETSPGQRLRKFYTEGEKQVAEIHAEALRLAEMKKEKKNGQQGLGKTADGEPLVGSDGNPTTTTTCECGGEAGLCGCKPGECGCAGCSKRTGGGEKAAQENVEKGSAAGQFEHATQDIKGASVGEKA